jgi:hypothetical protein
LKNGAERDGQLPIDFGRKGATMGGLFSGNRDTKRGAARLTVECCQPLSIADAQVRTHLGSVGALADGQTAVLTLVYEDGDGENVRVPVLLQRTRPTFGGRRWWFTCPLVVNGVPCGRRVGKLYLPPGAQYFGCRHCHDLTYQSAQEAHKWERIESWPDRARAWRERHAAKRPARVL